MNRVRPHFDGYFWLFIALMAAGSVAAFMMSLAGCAAPSARTETTGTGNTTKTDQSLSVVRSDIDRLMVSMDANFKLIEQLKIEARAGTIEKKDYSTQSGGQQARNDQTGLFNVAVAGGAGVSLVGMGWLLFTAWQRRQDRQQAQFEETEQTTRLRMTIEHTERMLAAAVERFKELSAAMHERQIRSMADAYAEFARQLTAARGAA